MMIDKSGIAADIFQHVEHIGIAVEDLEEADKLYSVLLGVPRYKVEQVSAEGVRTAFYLVGDTKIELLEALHDQSPIATFLKKRGTGVHHIAFEVADIRLAMQRLKREGFILTDEEPRLGADNKLVCFVHPKSAGGVLIELCQERPEDGMT